MYAKMLILLDGSKTAEQILPYARFVTSQFKKPVELIAVIDIAEMMAYVSAQKALDAYKMIQKGDSSTQAYLRGVADTFHGAEIECSVHKDPLTTSNKTLARIGMVLRRSTMLCVQ